MATYVPSPELTKAVLDAILAPVPYVAGLVFKGIPTRMKESAIAMALAQVVPLSLGSIALTKSEGARIVLTQHGELKEEVQESMLRRIAAWFVPNEVKQVGIELHKDVVRLAAEGYATDSWKLEVTDNEIVLVVINTSLIKQSTDTVTDLFFASHELLRVWKDKILSYVPRR
ncbi:MAG: hypothetical protein KBE09_01035 [Candidatus Pacebacteria bacterium]|nr:hypothetical protein [Candidatus Paceibacterota bacterium]